MKIIKAIKLHIKLRIKQEVLCNSVVIWSWPDGNHDYHQPCPDLNEFSSVNRAVEKIEDKIPSIYFMLNLFGGYIKKETNRIIKESGKINAGI